MNKTHLQALAAAAVLLGGGAFLQSGSAQERPAPRPQQIFESRCASCHTVPDPSFATDRAWLKQVSDTA
mgnify:CR=1 FL=1